MSSLIIVGHAYRDKRESTRMQHMLPLTPAFRTVFGSFRGEKTETICLAHRKFRQ